MAKIVEIIDRDASDTLNKVIDEVDSHGHTVREIWKNDLRSEFDKDHAVNGKRIYVYITIHVYMYVCVGGGGGHECVQVYIKYIFHYCTFPLLRVSPPPSLSLSALPFL
jgi:hypothetical protein